MGKLLTISVAAYNMEPYIRQCLDSLTDPAVVDDLEVFVVDDGGTDKTLKIAGEYEQRYPGTFRAVHKENGGYGSTVNYSLAHATGKYFKLLDGDDWYDTDGLHRLIKELKDAADTPDLVINRHYQMKPDEAKLDNPHGWSQKQGVCVPIEELHDLVCGMWGMTVRTAAIQGKIPDLLEHTLYTDQLFVIYSFAQARKVMFLDFPVYCYRIGRDGQSVSEEARIRHYKETLTVMKTMVEYYCRQEEKTQKFLLSRISLYYYFAVRTILLAPASKEMYREIQDLEAWMKEKNLDLYKEVGKHKRIKLIRLTGRLGYCLQEWGGYLTGRQIPFPVWQYRPYRAALSMGGAA